MAKANPVETVEPAVGQVYEDSSGTCVQILYVDSSVVLLRSEELRRDGTPVNRLERRDSFDKHVSSGYFTHQPEAEIDVLSDAKSDWSEVSYVGQKTEQALYEAGYANVLDVRRADDEELLAVSGVGERALENLRAFAE